MRTKFSTLHFALIAAALALGGAHAEDSVSTCAAGTSPGACAAIALDVEDESVALLQRSIRGASSEGALEHGEKEDAKANLTSEQAKSNVAAGLGHEEAAKGNLTLKQGQEDAAQGNLTAKHGRKVHRFPPPPALDNVTDAFMKVEFDGTKLEFHTGPSFPHGYDDAIPPYSEHFQGIARLQGDKYLAIAGSSHAAGNIFIVEMGSVHEGPGAWGSSSQGGGVPESDRVVAVIDVSTTLPHCGGMGVWEDIIAVPVEEACSAVGGLVDPNCPSESQVFFYDVSDPTSPQKLPYHIERPGLAAGAASLIQEPDGTFLLMVGRQHSYILDFYRTATTDLKSDPGWTLVGSWDKETVTAAPGVDDNYGRYQNVNFVKQSDGAVFLVGTTRDVPVVGWDWMDLYRTAISAPGLPFQMSVQKVATQKLYCHGCDFYAGAGVYIDNPESMMVYGVDWIQYDGIISFNEFAARSECRKDTGGSCSFFGCDSSRNAECSNGHCLCRWNECAVDGKCV